MGYGDISRFIEDWEAFECRVVRSVLEVEADDGFTAGQRFTNLERNSRCIVN